MSWKASFLGSFTRLLHRSLGWLLLAGSLFLLVQCGGGSGEGGSGEGGGGESDTPDLVIVGSKLSSKSAVLGGNLTITSTIKNQGTGISGGADSLQTVTFYRSSNKFISPRDEILGISSFGTLEPNAQSTQSFNFEARAGDNYYGACLGFTNDCQIGIKVSVPSPDISGSDSYGACSLSRGDGGTFMTSGSEIPRILYSSKNTFAERMRLERGEEGYYLLKVERKGILDIWITGSQDTVALLFDGNCNAITGHYNAKDGGIYDENYVNMISATAEKGYYFLVVHGKSLTERISYQIEARFNYPPRVVGDDPRYSDQWHLNNPNDQEIDINAPQAWDITRGNHEVLVAVIDGEVEITHPDLAPNHDDRYVYYGPKLGVEFEHGTLVAGLIVAKGNNGIGVSGVAPEVSFVSRGTVERGFNDEDRATSLIRDKEQVAISNNSWVVSNTLAGIFYPSDNYALYRAVITEGITSGYGGKGIFYVFGAGNSAQEGDNANYAPPTRYYNVTTICAVGRNGERSDYSEEGANLWICAPSAASYTDIQSGIVTTDITGMEGFSTDDYANDFGGTSASTPIVAGVAALMRSINPELGWRDIRLILAVTAQKNDSTNPGWFEGIASYDGSNYSGSLYQHNHEYGFGVVDAQAAVSQSQSWNNVGQMVKSSSQSKAIPTAKQQVPDGDGLRSVISVTDLNATLDFIEYVDIELNMDGEDYGDLQINLTSPANKTSTLAEQHDCSKIGVVFKCVFDTPTDIYFGSARHLGESPDGDWTLEVIDEVTGDNNNVYSWGLKFYGHKKP